MANDYDALINRARSAGRPVGGLEFEKAVSLAEVERTQAKTPEEQQAAQNKLDALYAQRAEGRRRVEEDRARNAALVRGDRKGAQAVEDSAALRQKIDEYAALGLSPKQARDDFRAELFAQAAGQAPGIVADSRQAIGGGGGANQGADPVLRAQDRVARLNERMLDVLGRIEAKMDDD